MGVKRIKCGICQALCEPARTRRLRFVRANDYRRHPGRVSACLTCSKAMAAANAIERLTQLAGLEITPGSFRVELGSFGVRSGDDG